jgi:hypothetical protein
MFFPSFQGFSQVIANLAPNFELGLTMAGAFLANTHSKCNHGTRMEPLNL